MRKLALLLLIAACGKDPGMGDDTMTPDGSTGSNDPNATFELKSPDILLPAGQEFTKCFYFHTPNTQTVAVNKWISDMTPGSHHMIMFLTPNVSNPPADGTIDENCGIGGSGGASLPAWTFASATEHYEMDMPDDDGAGKPLAQNIPPNTAGYIQMHYLNASDTDKMVHVDLKAYALDAATAYTQTDAYVTYVYNFTVPAGSTGYQVNGSCNVPSGGKFWMVSSHTHKQGVEVKINDGSSMLYDSTDWEHPAVKDFTSPFYSFASNKVSWTCTYDNATGPDIHEGQSAQTNEMCMATGYYFPASGPKFNVVIGNGGSCQSF